jgi:hypothetical protein
MGEVRQTQIAEDFRATSKLGARELVITFIFRGRQNRNFPNGLSVDRLSRFNGGSLESSPHANFLIYSSGGVDIWPNP